MKTSSHEFYSNVALTGDNILFRGYENGKRVQKSIPYRPTLFLETEEESEYRTLFGEKVKKIDYKNGRECRDFVKRYEDVDNFNVLGSTEYVYQFIGEWFPDEHVSYEFEDLKIAYIDIETTCENGFPDIDDPEEQINAITLKVGDKVYCLGLGDFHIDKPNVENMPYTSEEDLMKDFVELWRNVDPDIVTGWNVRFFDIPYIINRIKKLFGGSYAKKMSPWNFIKERKITKYGVDKTAYEMVGISILDYYELYRTFTYKNQESYRLDHIAHIELGERKLDYGEFDSIAEFYKKDFAKFMEYNYLDVILVERLESKLKLIELATALSYSAKVNYNDVFSQTRTWDAIIYHYLTSRKIVIPPKKLGKKNQQYAGAYVKDPVVGMHDWVVSFDLNSLYPHLIMQYNISPETIVREGYGSTRGLVSVDDILHVDKIEHIEEAKEKDLCIAANGVCFTKDFQGFLPELMEKMYAERKMYKKKMIEAQKLQQDIPKMNMPNLGRHALNEKCKNDIAKYNNFQLVRKIQLNSAYGALGNQYFRYYSTDMAEAVTLSGQLTIRWIEEALNEFLNETIGTKDYDYVVASDTDSVYLRLGNLVDKVCPSDATKQKVVEFLNKASEEIILPFITKKYDKLAKKMNAYQNKMIMEREVIAEKAVWTAKKRYMLLVHDSEGVRYDTPKMKIMGVETSRSSTPQVVRDSLKEAIHLILTTDEQTIMGFVKEFRTKFNNMVPEDIAFPRGVSNVEKYHDSNMIYQKATPIAVKGSLLYNHYIKKLKLKRRYREIIDGDKIKFLHLKKPNPMGGVRGTDQVIAFPNSLPKEFNLGEYIDYDTQFSKSFLEPLKTILEKIGWKHEESASLEGMFV